MSIQPGQIAIAIFTSLAAVAGVTLALTHQRSPQSSGFPTVPLPVASPSSPSASPSTSPAASVSPSASPTLSPTPAQAQTVDAIQVSPPTDNCKIVMARVNDPNPPLNVRSAPSASQGQVVGQLDNGRFVSVEAEQDGWFRIAPDPVGGWIAKNRTRYSCAAVEQRITFPKGGTAAIVTGEMIGTGGHRYVLRANQGQTLTITNLGQDFVFPSFVALPDQKLVPGFVPNEQAERWSGQLPVTGDYAIGLDSNFRGYRYSFKVEVK